MKTEKEFSKFFISCCADYSLHDSERYQIEALSTHYWSDLTGHLNDYFSFEDQEQITRRASQMLATNLKAQDFQNSWISVIRDFTQNQYWNFKTTQNKPVALQTEEQKIFWKLFKYAWAFFQSMVILKIAVYYFGLESASNPTETSVVWVWFFFFLSTASLVFFAYRNRHDQG